MIESTARSYAVHITEWFPPGRPICWGFCSGGSLAFGVALFVRRRALRDADWPTWALLAGALALAALAFRSTRNVGPYVVLAIPAASRVLGAEFRFRWRRRPRPASPDHPLVNLALLGGLGLIAVGFVAAAWIIPSKIVGWHPIPDRALAAIEACPGPLYNHYNDGGFLIWFTPDRPVYVDGRQDPYPVHFMLESADVEKERKPYRPVFARWGIRCAFLGAKSPIAKALASDGWRQRFSDEDWVVYEAPAAEHARTN